MKPEKKTARYVLLKKLLYAFLYCFYLFLAVLFLLEVIYRYQWVDFFRTELRVLNKPEVLRQADGRKTILIGGDSFTAFMPGYAQHLLEHNIPDHRVINSAVTGTSIVEASFIMPKRIKAFHPDIFIYQIYAGNDLMDIRHEKNMNEISWVRNLYWWLSERIHVLWYVNYKAGQWKARLSPTEVPSGRDQFNVTLYSRREKLWAMADPFLISNSVLLKNKRAQDLEILLQKLDEVIGQLKSGSQVYILVIPNKAQVNENYYDQLKAIGYQFDGGFSTDVDSYPFIEKIQSYFFNRSQVTVINPLPALREHDMPGHRLYFANDEHLNEKGHVVLASFIRPYLEERQ
ncbi:MAG: hypothetical protein ACOYXT_09040 [Bacteroidota bacterium]